MESAGLALILIPIRGGIGYLIGRKRKIGGGWAFVLGAFLGLIGWIIAACSKKKDAPTFDDITKGGDQ
ncbi:MAG: hypothetical protein IKN11_10400 [Bacteroidales bacterium]|nr:hypothetical protein [Bacteroidales bacterium]